MDGRFSRNESQCQRRHDVPNTVQYSNAHPIGYHLIRVLKAATKPFILRQIGRVHQKRSVTGIDISFAIPVYDRHRSASFCSYIKACFAASALIVTGLYSHASESTEVVYRWYPQTPGLQIEATDWRLQEENLPIWDRSWRCWTEKNSKCAIEHLEVFLERDLEEHQVIQVHSAIAQNYLRMVVKAFNREDSKAFRAVQEGIGKLDKNVELVKILNHQVAQGYRLVKDWKSCTKYGTRLMNAKETREFMLKTKFPMILADCFLRLNDPGAARHWVEVFLEETHHTRDSMSPSFDHVFLELDL